MRNVFSSAVTCASIVLLAACGGGGTGADPASVPPPTVHLSANPSSVASGQTSQLSWNTTDASSCNASGGWSGSQPTSGVFTTLAIATTTQFGLSCNGAGGNTNANTTVTV